MAGVHVVLCRPPVNVLHKFSKPVENLAMGYLGAALRGAGHTATLIDAMLFDLSGEETAQRIVDLRPDAVAFTTVLQYFPEELQKLMALMRGLGFEGPLLVGGHAVSFMAERILNATPQIDMVIVGEGEIAIVQFANAFALGSDWRNVPGAISRSPSGFVRNSAKRILDIDSLAPPARDLVPDLINRDGLVAISTSRGCYARCSFCSVPRFYGLERGKGLAAGDWLARDPLNVTDEVEALHQRFGVLELLFVDDEFFGGNCDGLARAMSLADLLASRRLPLRFAISCRAENAQARPLERLMEAGLTHVFVGLEAGSADDLKRYGKGHSVDQNVRAVETIKALGLSFQPGFMLFHYNSTLETIDAGLRFLASIGELKPVTVNTSMEPHFGAPIATDVKHKGVLRDEGLRLGAAFLDPRVSVVKRVAEECAAAFVPFMNVFAAIRSAVTWEWRRALPWRTPREEALLDAFERNVNLKLTTPVSEALVHLQRAGESKRGLLDDVLGAALSDLASAVEDLQLQQALVLAQINQVEGGVRYVSQKEFIELHKHEASGSAHALF